MTGVAFDAFDHESHMSQALSLAREAVERGDRPFGAVLVRDDELIMEESNQVPTSGDIRRHPELHIAFRVQKKFSLDERATSVMYTSTEPCSMCSGGIRRAELGRVVYSVGLDELAELTGRELPVRSAEILDGVTEVVGPVLNDEGRQIHREFYGLE